MTHSSTTKGLHYIQCFQYFLKDLRVIPKEDRFTFMRSLFRYWSERENSL